MLGEGGIRLPVPLASLPPVPGIVNPVAGVDRTRVVEAGIDEVGTKGETEAAVTVEEAVPGVEMRRGLLAGLRGGV